MSEQTLDASVENDETSLDNTTESGTSSEDSAISADREPRPLTQADDLRPGVVSKIVDHMANPDGGLPLKTVQETSGRSILLEFGDDSRLLIQVSAIASDVEIETAASDE